MSQFLRGTPDYAIDASAALKLLIKQKSGKDVRVMVFETAAVLNPYEMIEIICKPLHLTLEDIRSKSRKRHLIEARDMCIYFLKKFFPTMGHTEIATLVGYGDDHTMINHSKQRFRDMMHTKNPIYEMKYNITLEAVEKWLAEN